MKSTWMSKSSFAAIGILAVLALAAAPSSASADSNGLIIAPQGGDVVNARPLMFRVRAPESLRSFRAKLNGNPIGQYFDDPDGGERLLRASASYGLRHGKNRLRVNVKRASGKEASKLTKFKVRRNAPLAAAGIDAEVAVGDKIRLGGDSRSEVAKLSGRDGPGLDYSWAAVDAPHGAPPNAGLKHVHKARPTLRFKAPGEYRIRLTVTSKSGKSGSDVIEAEALPGAFVPIDTMATNDSGTPGIKVGNKFYAAAPGTQQNPPWFQVLVLNRKTLEPIPDKSKTYLCHEAPNGFCIDDELRSDLKELDSSNLVIAVNQPQRSWKQPQYLSFQKIGVRGTGAEDLPATGAGTFSAVGVPGLATGQADAKVVVRGAPGSGRMQGYLVRDENGESPDDNGMYTWLPPERVPFDTRSASECFDTQSGRVCAHAMTVGGHTYRDTTSPFSGYLVEIFDGHTLENVLDRPFSTSDGSTGKNLMNEFIRQNAPPGSGNLVMISAVEDVDQPTLAGDDGGTVRNLADTVASLGGSKDQFLRSGTTKGSHYSLVGWAGAGQGSGTETSKLKDPNPGDGRLRGVLTRDHDQEYRPSDTSAATAPSDALADLLVQPASKWPLDGDPGAQKALSWLGKRDTQLGPNPRSAYWLSTNTPADWNRLYNVINGVTYPGDKEGFTQADFDAAKAELLQELNWVSRTRSYLETVSAPFTKNTISGWDLKAIADQVTLRPPNDHAVVAARDIFSGMIKLLGSAAGGPGSGVANVFTMALKYVMQTKDGADKDQINARADQLIAETQQRMQQAQESFQRIGDIVVSDYQKLKTAGTYGKCNPQDNPDCPRAWQFTPDDVKVSTAAIWRSVESQFDQQFMSLTFPSYKLPQAYNQTDPRQHFTCDHGGHTVDHPLASLPDNGFAPLLQGFTPKGSFPVYEVNVMASLQPVTPFNPNVAPPPASVTNRMFGPVSSSTDPKQGGLGVHLPDYFLRTGAADFKSAFEKKAVLSNCGWH